MIDLPDIPPQYTPVVVAQASQTPGGSASPDRTVGVCQVLENPPHPGMPDGSAMNSMGPLGTVKNYFRINEQRTVETAGKISVLQKPEHGTLKITDGGDYMYLPQPSYLGKDSTTLLVEAGSLKIKLVYFFHVEKVIDDEDEKRLCPKYTWKISLNTK